MLKEAKRLHKLKLAVHWLKPNSKMPLESGWQKGKRKSWEELEDAYRYGLNVGVRLGNASRFPDDSFLGVVDCDVKSEDPKHIKEMEKKLAELHKEIRRAPEVSSGRGNGSRHIYVRTKTPIAPYRFAQSAEKVRVKMPSVKPSRFEEANLSEADRNNGIRLRAAWEISVMGEGQQVVLPPSLHPDTGGTYEWARPLNAWEDIPLIELKGNTAPRVAIERDDGPQADIVFEDVDLISSELPDSTVDLIMTGADCSDRSAALFGAAIAMVKARFTDAQILSVLTDRDNYLGEAAYEHANTTSRKRAASWVKRYTLDKVKAETSAANHFKEAVLISDLTDAEAEEQAAKVLKKDWADKIERGGDKEGGRPKSTLKNVHLILCGEAGLDIFKRDEFAGIDYYARVAPWGGVVGQEVRDIDLVHIKFWLASHYRFEPPSSMILEAIQKISSTNQFHPVKQYLAKTEWDGVERIDDWLTTYLGAVGPREYLKAVGRKTLCAMIGRVMRPGVKYDQVLVLEGPQGCGKSTAVRTLSEPWFTDAMINIGDKDAVLSMRSAWVMELGELSSMRKADIDQLKQFISQPTDRIRVPYGKLTESFPRQCIFIGTTNSSEYLKDTTGNRRFWPVQVTQCDFDALKADRDQLLAEARFAWELGEPLYIEDSRVEKLAMREQDARVFVDEWVGMLESFLKKEHENFPTDKFTISDLFSDFGAWPGQPATPPNQMRVANVLRVLGYAKLRMRNKDSRKVFWVKKEEIGHRWHVPATPRRG